MTLIDIIVGVLVIIIVAGFVFEANKVLEEKEKEHKKWRDTV